MAPALGSDVPLSTGSQVRRAARSNLIRLTSGLSPSYIQTNLIVLPSRYASDFRLLCARNPVPCPLLAESSTKGSFTSLKSYIPNILGSELASSSLDIRTDAPCYMVYTNGELTQTHVTDLRQFWTDDHVAFLIGCSFSFEASLAAAGLTPRHVVMRRAVPMYRTAIPLCAAGVFRSSTYVVSMRPYPRADIERVRSITRPFGTTHGEPIAWGWDAVSKLGIKDLSKPEWGEPPVALDGNFLDEGDEENIPVFWGCGVTPQEAIIQAKLDGVIMAHAPGHMLVLDVTEDDIFRTL